MDVWYMCTNYFYIPSILRPRRILLVAVFFGSWNWWWTSVNVMKVAILSFDLITKNYKNYILFSQLRKIQSLGPIEACTKKFYLNFQFFLEFGLLTHCDLFSLTYFYKRFSFITKICSHSKGRSRCLQKYEGTNYMLDIELKFEYNVNVVM